ncbi:hypothetical protein ACFPK9_15990 [Rubritalea spongiae]|uniref:Uncharacterized protein n=1 Tax=Rubritalea spongiae TaxID=430797 RepID=A0ABW5E606_9BACT
MASRKNELSVTLPEDLQNTPISQLSFELLHKRSAEAISVLDSFPPYPTVDPSKSYKSVLVSTKPKNLKSTDYTLNIYLDNKLYETHTLELRREFVTILDY